MLYDDELYMFKSNKIYAMLCYVMLKSGSNVIIAVEKLQ